MGKERRETKRMESDRFPLHSAVLSGNMDRFTALLESSEIDINQSDAGGRTALYHAVAAGSSDGSRPETNLLTVRLLLEHGARLDVDDVLEYAYSTMLWAELDILLGASTQDRERFKTIGRVRDDQLKSVIEHDYANVIALMLDLGLRINGFVDLIHGASLLGYVAHCGSLKTARVLIKRVMTRGEALYEFLDARCWNELSPLMLASREGHIDVVRELLKVFGKDEDAKRVYVNKQSGFHLETALMLSAEGGHLETVDILVKAGADVTLRDSRGRTALILASKHDHARVVETLLRSLNGDEAVRSLNMRDDDDMSAAMHARREVYDILVKSGGNYSARDEFMSGCKYGRKLKVKTLIESFTDAAALAEFVNTAFEEETGLLLSAEYGHWETVEVLLAAGAVDTVCGNGNTALTRASARGHVRVVRALLRFYEGSAVDYVKAPDGHGMSAVMYACSRGRRKVFDEFNKIPGAVRAHDKLMLACKLGETEDIEKLLADATDVETFVNERHNKETPLLVAASEGNDKIVSLLIKAGAKIAARDVTGRTALIRAAQNNSLSVVKILLRSHEGLVGYLDVRDEEGSTAVMYAQDWDYLDIVDELIKSGAQVTTHCRLMLACKRGRTSDVEDLLTSVDDVEKPELFDKHHNGHTVLTLSVKLGHHDIVTLLVEVGVDVTVRDEAGYTALIHASQEGHMSVVKLLIDACKGDKAEYVNMCEPFKYSAYSLAKRCGHEDIAELLVRYGATVVAEGD